MKHILIMETGSFKVMGGAAKDTYKIYKKLKLRKDYKVDLFGSFSKIDTSARPISYQQLMSKNYDLVWMNSIRDVAVAESYKKSHPKGSTKFMYVDRGNVLLNFSNAGAKRILPKMIARRYLTWKMQKWLDYYIAISVDQYDNAKAFFKPRTDVRYIMIAPHEEYKFLGKRKDFHGGLSVSRLDERQKKISFMIKGVARIKERHPEISDKVLLKIVGNGIDKENYKKLTSSMGLDRNIKFEGFKIGDALINEYNNAGFLVSTSEWEGLGRSLLEAMACGLPLLINNNINTVIKAKPFTRLVTDEENGLVYKYGDINEFADKFYLLYSDKFLQKKLSSSTRRFMSQFSFENVVESYERLIDHI